MEVTSPSGKKTSMYHGGNGGTPNTLPLRAGEYILSVAAQWGSESGHTRNKHLEFRSSEVRVISGGSPTKNVGRDDTPGGRQLGGFYGSSGNELDSIGFYWRPIK
ncbi:unnamed protein product [Phytophthora lilii]|uniref:Unnamed protein product n=1 Tax=Phytophthora lilii TaxID=2077276 RepID=A0A9W6TPQ4_9STRA|nr:unnamed protein product [Phytophthora lilii]